MAAQIITAIEEARLLIVNELLPTDHTPAQLTQARERASAILKHFHVYHRFEPCDSCDWPCGEDRDRLVLEAHEVSWRDAGS